MHLGFIGLGRMGANMVRRLILDGHTVVVYNRTPEKTTEIAGEGAIPSYSIPLCTIFTKCPAPEGPTCE